MNSSVFKSVSRSLLPSTPMNASGTSSFVRSLKGSILPPSLSDLVLILRLINSQSLINPRLFDRLELTLVPKWQRLWFEVPLSNSSPLLTCAPCVKHSISHHPICCRSSICSHSTPTAQGLRPFSKSAIQQYTDSTHPLDTMAV